jgi:dTMP kinase
MHRKRGVFITFEGPEGSGKSTQLRLLAERLRAEGREVFESAEPGGTPIGMQIRRVLLDAKNQEMFPTTELLLMFACRAQNVDQWILPALGEGRIVLSDRFTDSTLVYQGIARGLGAEIVYEVDRIACRGLVPDLTLVIDVEVETVTAAPRTSKRASMSRRSAFIAKCGTLISSLPPTSRSASS